MTGRTPFWPSRRTPRQLSASVQRRAQRAARYVRAKRRWQHIDPGSKRGLFVLGNQRSGTSLLLETLDRSPSTWVFGEGTNGAMTDYRLRDVETVASLIRAAPAPVTAIKPICDSHLADHILTDQTGSRVVWIYRRPYDCAWSQVERWGDHSVEVLEAIRTGADTIRHPRTGAPTPLGWRGERVPDEFRHLLADLGGPCTPIDAAVLRWYLRNLFYFELELDQDERVLLVSYERFCEDPVTEGRRVFEFAGCDFEPAMVDHVVARPPRAERSAGSSEAVRELAESLLARLERAHVRA